MNAFDFQGRLGRKKAQKLSVLPAGIVRAPIGASKAPIALRFFALYCGHTLRGLSLVAASPLRNLGFDSLVKGALT
jgi:hypothetical protein